VFGFCRKEERLNRIYLDHAATTPVHPEILEQMLPYFNQCFGNASSVYETGRAARKAIEKARKCVAEAIHCLPQEVYFTSGGTESDNWAIKGVAKAHQKNGNHIISSVIEHHAVLHSLKALEQEGYEITLLPVDKVGRVNPESVRSAIRKDTVLISIMAANNEIGTIQPVAEIGEIAKENGILFHTDAVQAVGAMKVDVNAWQADLLSLSAHKFHGPKGIGALYIRKESRVDSFMHGGVQERSRRAGTENLPGIVGLGFAIEKAANMLDKNSVYVSNLRDQLIAGIMNRIPEVRLNGDPVNRLPNNVNVSIRYIEGEALLLRLDMAGIAASSGSACTSGSIEPSHVLLALGLPREIAHGSLRLTLSQDTTREEINQVLEVLPEIVQTLREMSPLYDGGV
jgi:cysteine desulfurase